MCCGPALCYSDVTLLIFWRYCLSSSVSARKEAPVQMERHISACHKLFVLSSEAGYARCPWLGLEVEHRFARLHIDRHRDLIVHEQPLASELAPARGPTHPGTDLLPGGQGCARPVEAMAEGHILAHRDGQVSNFIADRTRKLREDRFPTVPHGIC